jgi:CRP-like cAMP-binding protein
MISPGSNLLLSALPTQVRNSLLRHASAVELPFGTVLYEAGKQPRYAYFLLSGLASIVVTVGDASAEVGMAGPESVIGGEHLLGSARIPSHCVMQLGGSALRISFSQLQSEFAASMELRSVILHLLQVQFAAMAQIAGCNRLHSAEQRLVRWLLTAQDKTQATLLKFTHESLAQMIATQRSTVTVVAHELQKRNYIEYSRGTIHILNRPGLETAACLCYAVVRNLNSGVRAIADSEADRVRAHDPLSTAELAKVS